MYNNNRYTSDWFEYGDKQWCVCFMLNGVLVNPASEVAANEIPDYTDWDVMQADIAAWESRGYPHGKPNMSIADAIQFLSDLLSDENWKDDPQPSLIDGYTEVIKLLRSLEKSD